MNRRRPLRIQIIFAVFIFGLHSSISRNSPHDDSLANDQGRKVQCNPLISAYMRVLLLKFFEQSLSAKAADSVPESSTRKPYSFVELEFMASAARRRMAFSAKSKTTFSTGAVGIVDSEEAEQPYCGMVLQVVEQGFLQHQYELEELVHTELGVTAEHLTDFVYKSTPVETDDAAPVEETSNDARGLVEEPPPLNWWSWWLPKEEWKPDSGFYQMNGNAFAGGSHGEVWRGRRKCAKNSESYLCEKKLVFKRLKIEKGYRVLEAGLREVYFGRRLNQLDREQDSDDEGRMFTHYADHFFREQSGKLELWIVFEDAGASLRSYMYTGTLVGDHVVYQQSLLWQRMRFSVLNPDSDNGDGSSFGPHDETRGFGTQSQGRHLLRSVLRQVLTAVAQLHENGIVLRDIKPSNILCKSADNILWFDESLQDVDISDFRCILGDFSSAWDSAWDESLYTQGPTRDEQTNEYAPPEAIFGAASAYHETITPSFDSWSVGILILELLLGTPNVFTVDQRTKVILTHKMRRKGASESDIQKALFLAALSQFCIYSPVRKPDNSAGSGWPLRHGDPLHESTMVQTASCTIADFRVALRARDPLGVGFDASADSLLHLVWRLLEFYPEKRISASEALQHPYFAGTSPLTNDLHAVESQMLDPRFDFNLTDAVSEFRCPKCHRVFADWRSCHQHANARKHSKFCSYSNSGLPKCINAHSLLPAHAKSGYCDIQGRRRVIEDFHTIHLFPTHQVYGIFDGHLGNLASKYAASSMYDELMSKNILDLCPGIKNWQTQLSSRFKEAFINVHESFSKIVHVMAHDTMDQSGTTATVMLVSTDFVVFAHLGDSRAILASKHANGSMISMQVTKDHVAGDPDERRDVERKGGFIGKSGGIDRVNGTLAVTRSIGDVGMDAVLSQDADVRVFTREEINDFCGTGECFVVLASDGLWDVMANQEVVELVDWKLSTEKMSNATSSPPTDTDQGFQLAAEALVHQAYIRGSTDNIGVCVVGLLGGENLSDYTDDEVYV